MRHIHVIINPISGRPQPVLYTLNSVFREAGVSWDVSVTQNSEDACRAAKTAATQGVDVVAAYGGDGTVLEAATGLLGTTTPLAILPGGTANILSVELGIPHDLAAAAQIACSEDSSIRKVDLGQSGEQFFIQRIGIGLDADKVNRATRELKQKYGRLAYSIGWIQALHETPIAHYMLQMDGREEECDGVTCHIANAGSIGVPGLKLLPDISVSDGLLDVLVVRKAGLGSALSIASIAAGHPIHSDAFHHWQVRDVAVTSDSPQRVHADGEMWADTPLTVQVVPEAVGILTHP